MNFSKQRELVKDIVISSHDHPTAEMVYSRAKELMPNIGMATVYRNLNVLVQAGALNRLSFPGDIDRYDDASEVHDHAICLNCKKIIDIHIPKALKQEILLESSKAYKFQARSCNITVEVLCDDCMQKH